MIQTKQSKYVSVVLYSPLPVYWHTAKDWCLNMISNGENTARMSLRFNDLTPVWQCSYVTVCTSLRMRGSKWPATSNQNKVKPKFRGDRVDITTGSNFKIYSGDTLWCKRNNIMFSLCLLLDWCSLHIRERPYSGEGVRGIPVAWFISIINNGSYGWLDGRASGKELAMLWTHEIDVQGADVQAAVGLRLSFFVRVLQSAGFQHVAHAAISKNFYSSSPDYGCRIRIQYWCESFPHSAIVLVLFVMTLDSKTRNSRVSSLMTRDRHIVFWRTWPWQWQWCLEFLQFLQ